MQKKLIALAVAGAMTAPLAAQAETTIYGKMHVSIDSITNDNSALDTDSSLAVSSNASRLGFKGSEELGGGLKAIWQSESAIDLANKGGNTLSGRNSYLGLQGGFGKVLAGRHDTPYKTVGRKVELFGDSVGDFRSVTNAGVDIGNDARTDNTIAYITPNMGGLSAAVAYVTDVSNPANDNTDNSAMSASLNYDNGPLFAAFGYQSIGSDNFGPNAESQNAMRLVGSFKMATMKFNAMYFDETGNDGVDTDNDRTGFLLGGAFGMGNNTFKAQYLTVDGEADNSGADKLSVGFDHAMSKSTSVYAAYATVTNDDNASYHVVGSGHGDRGPSAVIGQDADGNDIVASGTEAGGSPNAFSLGMIHKF